MTAPRIEIDLSKVRQNARDLVDRLAPCGISVVGVTKGVCGQPDIARAMLEGGVVALGDARVSNVERMRAGGIRAPIILIRTPMHSQIDRIVRTCNISLNVDFGVVEALACAACRADRVHKIVLMVEMGDGREGMPPAAVSDFARRVMNLRGIKLIGIGANFACLSGRAPSPAAMQTLSELVTSVERDRGVLLRVVSGGNSANLTGLPDGRPATRVNELRLGEAILLGRDPLTHQPIEGLATDAFALVAEVIESRMDAQVPDPGRRPIDAFLRKNGGGGTSLLALGKQDTDTGGLSMPGQMTLLGSTSDHLILRTPDVALAVGAEVRFGLSYSALMQAMSAPDIATIFRDAPLANRTLPGRRHQRELAPT